MKTDWTRWQGAALAAMIGSALCAGAASAEDAASTQAGEIVRGTKPSVEASSGHPLDDARKALKTYEAVFAAYVKTPLLSPPRGFKLLHNENVLAAGQKAGRPIEAGGAMILLAYNARLPRAADGRYAAEGEGPVLGGIRINDAACGNKPDPGLGSDETSDFYYEPKQIGTAGGWPQYQVDRWTKAAFLSKRTAPRWLPVSVERVLKVRLAQARAQRKDASAADSARPQNAYQNWLDGKAKRLQSYQETHDMMAKTNKAQADQLLAQLLKSEDATAQMFQQMAAKGGGLNAQIDKGQADAEKSLRDLEAKLASLSPAERAAQAHVYMGTDNAFPVGAVVPPSTPNAAALVYPNPDFFDRALPPWEAQSICASLGAGPRTQEHWLYPTILKIWDSLDWNGLAKLLK
jgi:hypothetical protein